MHNSGHHIPQIANAYNSITNHKEVHLYNAYSSYTHILIMETHRYILNCVMYCSLKWLVSINPGLILSQF